MITLHQGFSSLIVNLVWMPGAANPDRNCFRESKSSLFVSLRDVEGSEGARLWQSHFCSEGAMTTRQHRTSGMRGNQSMNQSWQKKAVSPSAKREKAVCQPNERKMAKKKVEKPKWNTGGNRGYWVFQEVHCWLYYTGNRHTQLLQGGSGLTWWQLQSIEVGRQPLS